MGELSFTAGVTLHDNRTITVDVTAIDGTGLTYTSETGDEHIAWADLKAVMLATTDHMLESGGALFAMAERLDEAGDDRSRDAEAMRRLGAGLLREAATRVCPQGSACGLRPGAGPSAP